MNPLKVKASTSLALLFSTALGIAGCGSAGISNGTPGASPSSSRASVSASDSPSAKIPAPCVVVNEVDAATALGYDPGPGQPEGQNCLYREGDGTKGALTVSTTSGGRKDFDALRSSTTQQSGNAAFRQDLKDLVGVGDAAYLLTSQSIPGATVVVLKGSTILTILITPSLGGDNSRDIDVATALATAAAAKI